MANKRKLVKRGLADAVRHGIHMGWKKSDTQSVRRYNALTAHKGNALAAARALQALANINSRFNGDTETHNKAHLDAVYFFNVHRRDQERTQKIGPRAHA